MTIYGGCLCGKVRYQVSGILRQADHCHCSMCRRQHGAAFASYAEVNPDEFEWVTGENLTRNYEKLPGSGWCFCSECGSSLAGTDNGRVTSRKVRRGVAPRSSEASSSRLSNFSRLT